VAGAPSFDDMHITAREETDMSTTLKVYVNDDDTWMAPMLKNNERDLQFWGV